jgi:hypothetical protein
MLARDEHTSLFFCNEERNVFSIDTRLERRFCCEVGGGSGWILLTLATEQLVMIKKSSNVLGCNRDDLNKDTNSNTRSCVGERGREEMLTRVNVSEKEMKKREMKIVDKKKDRLGERKRERERERERKTDREREKERERKYE